MSKSQVRKISRKIAEEINEKFCVPLEDRIRELEAELAAEREKVKQEEMRLKIILGETKRGIP